MGNSDRTEKATPKRRRDARRRGQVAKSVDFNGAIVLAGAMVAITMFGPTLVDRAGGFMTSAFQQIANPGAVVTGAGLGHLFDTALNTLLVTVAPMAGLCLVLGLLSNVVQVGFRPSLGAVKPDIKRINPASGFKNVFGARMVFEGGKTVAKVAVVGAVTGMALIPQLSHLGSMLGTPPGLLGHLMTSSASGIAQRAAIAYFLIAVVDLVWQRRRHARMLRMTRQEVREEHKQHSLPPEVRTALRRRQMQAARKRMMAAVPDADVVVTNPTHFAVALSYDGSVVAPVVVAKGQDLVAAQIRRVAEESDVPIVSDPPLARSLHASVEIGHMIPAELYAAVAQILAFVYRTASQRRARA